MAISEKAKQQCREILKKMWDFAVEDMKDEAEAKQCSFADLIAEARAQGEDVPPFVEQLILSAEGKI